MTRKKPSTTIPDAKDPHVTVEVTVESERLGFWLKIIVATIISCTAIGLTAAALWL